MIDWYDINARHEAAILWLGALSIVALAASSGVRQSVLELLKTLGHRTILSLYTGLLLVVTALAAVAVYLGRSVGLWETLPVVTVSVWAVSSGVALLLNFGDFLGKDGEFRRAAAVLTPATIIAALADIAILSFWWEVALFPVLAFLAIMFAYNQPEHRNRQLHSFAKMALLMYTLALVGLAIANLVQHPDAWKHLVQAGVMPIWLTVGTLPYIRLLILIEQWRFRSRCPNRIVSSDDYGSNWLLVVDSAKLCCKHGAVWIEANGRKYGLNGTARAMLPRWGFTCSNLEEIRRYDPSHAGSWIGIHRLLRDGLTLGGR